MLPMEVVFFTSSAHSIEKKIAKDVRIRWMLESQRKFLGILLSNSKIRVEFRQNKARVVSCPFLV